MTGPDAAQDKALEAATAISNQVGRLWMEAHAAGVRNGFEGAALALNGMAEGVTSKMPGYAPWTAAEVVDLLQTLRDQIRLMALQVPEPEVPSV